MTRSMNNEEPQELMDEYHKLGSEARIAVLGYMTGYLGQAASSGTAMGTGVNTIIAEARRAALDSLYGEPREKHE